MAGKPGTLGPREREVKKSENVSSAPKALTLLTFERLIHD